MPVVSCLHFKRHHIWSSAGEQSHLLGVIKLVSRTTEFLYAGHFGFSQAVFFPKTLQANYHMHQRQQKKKSTVDLKIIFPSEHSPILPLCL